MEAGRVKTGAKAGWKGPEGLGLGSAGVPRVVILNSPIFCARIDGDSGGGLEKEARPSSSLPPVVQLNRV